MLTLFLQCVVDVLTLAFAGIAMGIVRTTRGSVGGPRTAWLVTGLAFAIIGVSSAIQDLGAVWAFSSGPGTEVYARYLAWSPVGNHSRNLLVLAYGACLLYLCSFQRSSGERFVALTLGGFFLASVLGGIVGYYEGAYVSAVHLSALAVFNTLTYVVLLGALLRAVVTDSMDRLLWFCVTVYSLRGVLEVIWHSALAWIRVDGVWAPSPAQMQLSAVVAYAAMSAIAFHRLRLAQRGVPVGALLELPAQRKFSTLG